MSDARDYIRSNKYVELELIDPGDQGEDLIMKAPVFDGRAIRNAGFRPGDEVILVTKKDFDEYLRLKKRIKAIEDRGIVVMA